jgi:sugar phosphate isomerase/epimerase
MKFAICNELYENVPFADVCRSAAEIGYTGLEVAPFTLAPLVTDVAAPQRTLLRQQAADAGLEIIGLHWLLAKTKGFHLNHPERAVRQRTSAYLVEQVKLCADLGGKLMVFGSPGARQILPGLSRPQAMELAAEALADVTSALADHDVHFCLEPLSTQETSFLNSADEAAELMQMIGHPNVTVHLDVKAMSAEGTPIPDIIRAHRDHIGHFHANDPNLRGPGMGNVDFVPIFQSLEDIGYSGWVSVEVFDFKPDPVTIARESLQYMLGVVQELRTHR